MNEVRNEKFQQEAIRLDGKLFVDCVFEACLLHYGGDQCEWERSRFSNCRLVLDGAANNTVQVLRALGFEVIEPTSDSTPASHRQIYDGPREC
jgi:hypothetical protein